MSAPAAPLARSVKGLSHVEVPGAGQVYVAGDHAYIGHMPNPQSVGTSVVDVSDPRKPRIVSQIRMEDPDSHSHKARVIGDHALRFGDELWAGFWQAGLRVIDVSDIRAPRTIGECTSARPKVRPL